MTYIIFFAVVLTVFVSVNFYIFSRGIQALPAESLVRSVFPWMFWVLATTYVAGRFLERVYISVVSDILIWVCSFWLGAMFYFFLAVLLIDIFRLINHLVPFFPSVLTANIAKVKIYLFFGILAGVAITLAAGHINTLLPKVNKVNIHIYKEASDMKELNAVLISDLHLGTLKIGRAHV